MDSSSVTAPTQVPLSKSAQKKAARASYIRAQKFERRAREKERRKEKKRAQLENNVQQPRSRKKTKVERVEFGARVVIDLGFDELMNDKVRRFPHVYFGPILIIIQEITSLCSQLAYTYSANRRASFPFSLLFTALGGRTRTRLDGINDAGHKRWQQTEWWDEGYERLWIERDEILPSEEHKHNPAITAKENVVYLTADADEELMELSPNETYIIGGICDHNRYKVFPSSLDLFI
jgi:tRNA (guanine9-N1)-methyltransferase